ncbi:MAG TPA: hypothetical protein VGB15_21590, partial [Longimicrobium sp.]
PPLLDKVRLRGLLVGAPALTPAIVHSDVRPGAPKPRRAVREGGLPDFPAAGFNPPDVGRWTLDAGR